MRNIQHHHYTLALYGVVQKNSKENRREKLWRKIPACTLKFITKHEENLIINIHHICGKAGITIMSTSFTSPKSKHDGIFVRDRKKKPLVILICIKFNLCFEIALE